MKINVKGPIISNDEQWIYDMFEMESTSPKDIESQLPTTNEEIEVIINSGGGDVYAGSEIYTTLKSYPGIVNVKIVGIAASSASVIAMAGDKVEISPTAQMMIHNVSMIDGGDHKDFAKGSEILKGHDKSIASSYEIKTGKTLEELLNLMNDETWFDAKSAVEHGFADEVMFSNDAPKLVASITTPVFTPKMIDKVRAMKESKEDAPINMDSISKIVDQAIEKALSEKEVEEIVEPTVTSNKFDRFTF